MVEPRLEKTRCHLSRVAAGPGNASHANLDEIFPSLNHSQKMMVALDMTRLTRELMTISNPTHGTPLKEDLASPRLP